MTPHALLFTLAAIGISETAYLVKKRRMLEKPFCPLGETCHVVLESKYNKQSLFLWNKIFLIHNDILGLVFYIIISFIAAFLVLGTEPVGLWEMLAKILIFAGAVFSLFLTFLQWKVIKAWCTWCLMSALTVFLMTIITIVLNLKGG